MSKELNEILARLETKIDAVDERQRKQAELQETQAEQTRFVIEGIRIILRLLEPKPRDGPSLDELLGHVVGRLTELLVYARGQIRIATCMDESLPGDVVRAVAPPATLGEECCRQAPTHQHHATFSRTTRSPRRWTRTRSRCRKTNLPRTRQPDRRWKPWTTPATRCHAGARSAPRPNAPRPNRRCCHGWRSPVQATGSKPEWPVPRSPRTPGATG